MTKSKGKDGFKLYWLNPKVEPRPSPRRGDGLFAKNKLKRGECILMIGGNILTVEEEAKLPGKSADNGVQIAKDLVLCTVFPEEYGGANYLNHGCEPNAEFNGQIAVVAMRDIARNEEITIDYAMVLHKAGKGPTYRLECLCGEERCRRVVTENDWKKPELQEKYRGYFQPYLAEIEKLKKRRSKLAANEHGGRSAVPPVPTPNRGKPS